MDVRMMQVTRRLMEDLTASSAARGGRRYIVGIAGPPGSGKSTLAHALMAPVVSMDGFHLRNAELERRGLRSRKGSPATFDVPRFVGLLHQLRAGGTARAPIYSRELHEPVDDAAAISADDRVVIVEGNYLLLDEHPWSQVRPLLDEAWYLDTPPETCMQRVLARHIAGGMDPEAARRKVATNDRPNAAIVARTRDRATQIVTLTP